MFRRNKYGGEVTIVDDANDDYRELMSGARAGSSQEQVHQEQVHQESAAELEAAALAAAQSGKDGTRRAKKLAAEAREIGIETASTLNTQTKQLERMGEEIEVVHDYLDKSERIIDKMSKPKIVRMFQRKKPTGKGLDKVKVGRKERAARDEMREAGVGGIDLDALANGPSELEREEQIERERAQLLGADEGRKPGRLFRKSKAEKTVVGVREIREDYSQYSEGVANVMREQDKDLDEISDAIGDMKMLANAMNNELNYQNELIDDVQKATEETRKRTKDHVSRVERIK